MRERTDVRDSDRSHLVGESRLDPARLEAETELLRIAVEGRRLHHVEELDLCQLLLCESNPSQTLGVLIDKRPEGARLDRDQAHRSIRSRQADDSASNETSQVE